MIYLVIRTTSADENLSFMFLKLELVFLERSDDALECGSDVGEVGDSAADDELFAIWMVMSRQERKNGPGVVVSLLFTGRAGIFAVIGEFRGSAELANCVARKTP